MHIPIIYTFNKYERETPSKGGGGIPNGTQFYSSSYYGTNGGAAFQPLSQVDSPVFDSQAARAAVPVIELPGTAAGSPISTSVLLYPFPLQYISPSSLSLFSSAAPLKLTQTNTA